MQPSNFSDRTEESDIALLQTKIESLQQSESVLVDRLNDLEHGIIQQSRNLRRVRVVLALCVVALSTAGILSLNSASAKDQDVLRQQIATLMTTAMIGCTGVLINEIQKERKP